MEKDMTTLTTKAEHTLTIYEEQIVEAEKVMSLQVTDTATTAPPPSQGEQPAPFSAPSSSSLLALFWPQSDLKPAMLGKESTYREVIYLQDTGKLHGSGIWEPEEHTTGYGRCTATTLHQSFMGIRSKTFEPVTETI